MNLHTSGLPRVKSVVRFTRLWIALLALPVWAADAKLAATLAGVESRYNRAKTLQVLFQEDYTPPGRPRRTESGTLWLRKPGRMRWDYTQPKGKLFISDGKTLWLYTPADNRAERMKLQESEEKTLAQHLTRLEASDHGALLAELATLAEPLEAFFSSVMVKCEDLQLRAARLSLLHRLRKAFLRVADFSQWQ